MNPADEKKFSTSSNNTIGEVLIPGQFPFEHLIDHIIRRQHAKIGEESLRLQRLAVIVAAREAGGHRDRAAIPHLMESLISDLAVHVADEESRFPLLLGLELAYIGEGPVPAYSQSMRDVLRSMSAQHRRRLKMLSRLCILAGSLSESGDQTARDFSEGFSGLYRASLGHSRIEVEMFTRAAAMEAEIRCEAKA